MSNLILFTNRSGSTVLADIIAFNDRSINLGEGLHSLARDYNYNSLENKDTTLYKDFSTVSLTRDHHNPSTRGSDHIGFFTGKSKRINQLKFTNLEWTVKENLEKQTADIPFIDYCINNNVKVYITHRRDIQAQFLSVLNARYRLEIAKQQGPSQFIYTNQDQFQKYNEMRVPFNFVYMYLNVFIDQLLVWRAVYEKYKNQLTVVSYEDNIRPMDFTSIGISNNVVDQYKKETQYLVPTPNNTNKVIVVDDHKGIQGTWEQTTFFVDRFKYLVDI